MTRQVRPAPKLIDAKLAWAASAAAHRVQKNQYTGENRALVSGLVQDPSSIMLADWAHAEAMIQYFQGLMFKVISGERMSGYLNSLMQLANSAQVTEHNLGLLASAVKCHAEMSQRDEQKNQEKMLSAQSQCLGQLGEKLEFSVQVIRSSYSEKYGVYFVTAVVAGTSDLVFFSFKRCLDYNTEIRIRGTVKRHTDDRRTQLNRVKILDNKPADC